MAQESIKFGVELDRKTDGEFKDIAQYERRSKRSMHTILIRRVARLWKENPRVLEDIGLIRKGD